MTKDIIFNIPTPIGFTVRESRTHWNLIATVKHPLMKGLNVYLFYRAQHPERWICAVVKRLNGEGFLITAYITDKIKEGNIIWKK
jgi:hypothetical protein